MALFQLLAIVLFYAMFIGRSIEMHRRGERVFVIGKGKGGVRALLEMVFMAGLLIWSGEIVLRGLWPGASFFPAVMGKPCLREPGGGWPGGCGDRDRPGIVCRRPVVLRPLMAHRHRPRPAGHADHPRRLCVHAQPHFSLHGHVFRRHLAYPARPVLSAVCNRGRCWHPLPDSAGGEIPVETLRGYLSTLPVACTPLYRLAAAEENRPTLFAFMSGMLCHHV